MHVFDAYGAILLHFALNASVGILHVDAQTTLALVAMEEVFSTANAAYSTTLTVKDFLPLIIVIEEITHFAKVARELYLALLILTFLLRLLNSATLEALNIFDRVSVHLVILLRVHLLIHMPLIVAKPASKELFTSWTLFLASSTVVLAAILRVLRINLIFYLVLIPQMVDRESTHCGSSQKHVT